MSALDEVLEVGVDDYWAEHSRDVMKQALAELAQLRTDRNVLKEKVEQMEYAIREDIPRWNRLLKIEDAAKEYVAESERQKYNVQPEFYRLAAMFNKLAAALKKLEGEK